MSGKPRAKCPICSAVAGIFAYHGDVIYECHGDIMNEGGCEAGGWLVEDAEVIQAPGRQHGERQTRQRPIKHGSYFGAASHRRRAEVPCDECRAGERAYQAKRYREAHPSPAPVPCTQETRKP